MPFPTNLEKLKGLEFKTLVVFDAVMSSGSQQAAAEILGMEQSTVNYHISKIQRVLGEKLFTRGIHGSMPTNRAHQLEKAIVKMVEGLNQSAFFGLEISGVEKRPIKDFYRFICDEISAISLVPHIVDWIGEVSPNVNIDVDVVCIPSNTSLKSLLGKILIEEMEKGNIDLAIGQFPILERRQEEIKRQSLRKFKNISITNRENRNLVGESFKRNAYCNLKINSQLCKLAVASKTAITVEISESIMTLIDAGEYEVVQSDQLAPIFQYWHSSMQGNISNKWIRKHVKSIADACGTT